MPPVPLHATDSAHGEATESSRVHSHMEPEAPQPAAAKFASSGSVSDSSELVVTSPSACLATMPWTSRSATLVSPHVPPPPTAPIGSTPPFGPTAALADSSPRTVTCSPAGGASSRNRFCTLPPPPISALLMIAPCGVPSMRSGETSTGDGAVTVSASEEAASANRARMGVQAVPPHDGSSLRAAATATTAPAAPPKWECATHSDGVASSASPSARPWEYAGIADGTSQTWRAPAPE